MGAAGGSAAFSCGGAARMKVGRAAGRDRGRAPEDSGSPAANGSGAACGAAGGGRWSLVAGLERRCGADGSGLVTGPRGPRSLSEAYPATRPWSSGFR